jgi:hypothetical protein
VLDELKAENMGLEKHIVQNLRPLMGTERYWSTARIVVGDPSGVAKNNHYEETSFDLLKRAGFTAFPAPTNDLDPRLRAIEFFLLQQVDGGPAMVIDADRCPTIVRALGGGYRYEATKAGVLKAIPKKDEYSHVIDALQYACLVARGGENGLLGSITSRIMRKPARAVPKFSSRAWT